MIKAFLCDTSALLPECAEQIIKDTPALAGVLYTQNGKRRTESASAYILLAAAYSLLFPDQKMPRVLRAEGGKPCFDGVFCGERLCFSISHRGGAALVAFCMGSEVGADVEAVISEKTDRMEALAERYLRANDCESASACPCELTLSRMRTDGTVDFLGGKQKNDNDDLQIEGVLPFSDAWTRWTSLEAVLKIRGGGFGDLARAGELFLASELCSFEVSFGERRYAITLAKEK